MTKEDFLQGWNLLVAQPWGRRYATVNDRETAIIAATQLQFYFKKLGHFPSDVWQVECELYAAGDHWPSIDELKQSCRNVLPRRKQLEYENKFDDMPEPIALSLAHAEANNTTFLEGMQAVLPRWCKENSGHHDYLRAMDLYEKFKDAKPATKYNFLGAIQKP